MYVSNAIKKKESCFECEDRHGEKGSRSTISKVLLSKQDEKYFEFALPKVLV